MIMKFKLSKFLTFILIFSWLVLIIPANCKNHIPEQKIRQHISQILQNPEYNQVYQKNAPPTWLERFLKFLANLFGTGNIKAPNGSSLILTVMAVTAAIIFCGIAIFVISKIIKKQSHKYDMDDGDLLRYAGSSKKLMSMANDYANKGDFRTALKYSYTAVLSVLDEKQIIKYDKTRTNRSYVYELKDKKINSAADFESATNTFDKIIYGYFDCLKTDFESCQRYYNQIISEKAA